MIIVGCWLYVNLCVVCDVAARHKKFNERIRTGPRDYIQ